MTYLKHDDDEHSSREALDKYLSDFETSGMKLLFDIVWNPYIGSSVEHSDPYLALNGYLMEYGIPGMRAMLSIAGTTLRSGTVHYENDKDSTSSVDGLILSDDDNGYVVVKRRTDGKSVRIPKARVIIIEED